VVVVVAVVAAAPDPDAWNILGRTEQNGSSERGTQKTQVPSHREEKKECFFHIQVPVRFRAPLPEPMGRMSDVSGPDTPLSPEDKPTSL